MDEVTGGNDGSEMRELRNDLIRDALVAGDSYREAAEVARVSPRTVRRLMESDAFRSEVIALRAERTAQLSARLSETGREAVRVLTESLVDESSVVRLRAAQMILSLGTRFRREVEMGERIDVLERRLEALLDGDTTGGQFDAVT